MAMRNLTAVQVLRVRAGDAELFLVIFELVPGLSENTNAANNGKHTSPTPQRASPWGNVGADLNCGSFRRHPISYKEYP